MSNKIEIENEVPELLEAVCQHKDCPRWLKNAIWEAFNNQHIKETFTADYWRSQFGGIYEPKPEGETKDGGLDALANQLSAVMKNPLLPTNLYNVMTDELTENPYDTDSPEWIRGSLQAQIEKSKEASND